MQVDEIEEYMSGDISETSSVLSFKENMKRITGQVGVESDSDDDIMMTDSSLMDSQERTERTRKFSLSNKSDLILCSHDPKKERTKNILEHH